VSFSVPEGAAQWYEILRHDLLQPESETGSGIGRTIVLRRGMAAWIRERDNLPPAPTLSVPATKSETPFTVASELVRLLAGLILSRGKDCRHA
jgi:hypothetical protein